MWASGTTTIAINVHLQAMELASSLRQALDESRQMSWYCNTLNMSWFDWSSRLMQKEMDQMNFDLGMLGETQWEFHEPAGDPLRIAS